ncbi:N-acetylmuramoyl-L-alanine amidase [Parvularcula sp. LCG005]|uniref:N-acetylmuramoyl-L-alanine amidase family protein n=1 Tax=Parvularcula sp. LCG005 TaxID=3078805 RepID=UPI0029434C07|nr:N-acetylmuramoyl-L-alanine amidase [Parvularcula sp. LCG005]WOI52106.1 N-acetylmuramoyl-L-alanine amidase [Parvularcula sp. LCG005]
MKRALTLWSVGILSFCGVLALANERQTAPVVQDIRLGVDGAGQTRLVLDLDDAPIYQVIPQAGGQGILRVEVARASFSLTNGIPSGKGVVAGVSMDDNEVVVALQRPALPVKTFVLEPTKKVDHYRLVVDLKDVPARTFTAAAETAATEMAALPSANTLVADLEKALAESEAETKTIAALEDQTPPAPSPKPRAQEPSKAEEALPAELLAMAAKAPPTPSVKPRAAAPTAQRIAAGKTMVVIDAGHGGHDPGAIGSTGLQEKTVTIAAAKSLATELRARGYAVSLIRDDDTFIDVHDRIEIARDLQADLFISLHADANPEPLARGASVYTLSEDRNAKMAKEVASNGNFRVFDVDVSSNDDVSKILYDLANTDTKNQSSRLASAMIAEMRGRVPMVNNTHRKASLQVLLSPDVPAVLVEMAFLSNRKDEANLASEAWRDMAMTSIADGIDTYFDTTPARQANASGAGGSP